MHVRLLPLLVAAAVALALAVPALRRWLASDETLIRRRLGEALADFGEGRARRRRAGAGVRRRDQRSRP